MSITYLLLTHSPRVFSLIVDCHRPVSLLSSASSRPTQSSSDNAAAEYQANGTADQQRPAAGTQFFSQTSAADLSSPLLSAAV